MPLTRRRNDIRDIAKPDRDAPIISVSAGGRADYFRLARRTAMA
jgi:hypothetical protein